MANRAYLYANDDGDSTGWHDWYGKSDQQQPYADSRHTLPFAWLFFYSTDAIKVHDGDGVFSDVRLIAPKIEAIARFEARLPLLFQLTGDRYDSNQSVSVFLDAVRSWRGEYLCVDADSIWETETEETVLLCTRVLAHIDQPTPNVAQIMTDAKNVISVLSDFSYFRTPANAFHTNLLGAWYN